MSKKPVKQDQGFVNPNDSKQSLPAQITANLAWWEVKSAVRDAIKAKYKMVDFEMLSFSIRNNGEMEVKVRNVDIEHPVVLDATTTSELLSLHVRAVHKIELLTIVSYSAKKEANKYIQVKAETQPSNAQGVPANKKPKGGGDGSA